MYNIALADDHVLLRKGLANLVKSIGYHVVLEAGNGDDLISQLPGSLTPDVVLMDINMPQKDGYETTAWLAENFPAIKVLALTMIDDEDAVIRMLRLGARGYLLKESQPAELKAAIDSVMVQGFYYTEMVTGKLISNLTQYSPGNADAMPHIHLTEKEAEFLRFTCTEMTYKEIAGKMKVSPRTVDTYRDHLFEKLELKTRTGLVIYAIKHGLVKL